MWYPSAENGEWETIISYLGYPFRVRRQRVPRIDDNILHCVFYLYPSVQDAKMGEKYGGTGFFVGLNSRVHSDLTYVYAVTNSHVLREGGAPVIRLNTQDDKMDIIPLTNANWVHHPDGDDVAICELAPASMHRWKFIPSQLLLTKDIIAKFNIGIGDETFMVGRFVNHEGKQRNLPSVRFGNIAMMPLEPVLHQRGHLQESFVVESRSLPGYSGSPVFVFLPPFSDRQNQMGIRSSSMGPWLLGIDWGHNRSYEKVREKNGNELSEGWVVRSNSGMMNVIPTWIINDLLNIREFVEHREESDARLAKAQEHGGAQLDFEMKDETFTRDDYIKSLSTESRAEPDELDKPTKSNEGESQS
jgi:hypothetical protein